MVVSFDTFHTRQHDLPHDHNLQKDMPYLQHNAQIRGTDAANRQLLMGLKDRPSLLPYFGPRLEQTP